MLPGKYHPEDDHIHVFPEDYPPPAPQPQFVRISDWPQTQIIQRDWKPLSGFSPAGENLGETPEVSRPEPRTVENPFQQRLQQSRQEDHLGGLTEEVSIVLLESKPSSIRLSAVGPWLLCRIREKTSSRSGKT